MRILLTGASSFTGMWFAETLAGAGHDVIVPLRRKVEDYDGLRRERIDRVAAVCSVREGMAFGDRAFLDLVRDVRPERLCHHASRVDGYREPDFDVAAAVADNARGAHELCGILAEAGCGRLVYTGSVFEPGEGAGSDGLRSFSGYGLSKALSAQLIEHYAALHGVPYGKFVIPNPFGPFEEPRFTAYLMRTWMAGDTAGVRTPAYVRDNIHAPALARAYCELVESTSPVPAMRANPSGYRESQGAFTERMAAAMRERLDLPCSVELSHQTEFPEPRERVNTDPVSEDGWSEDAAWDALAAYYEERSGA